MYYTTEAYFKEKFDNAYRPFALRAQSAEEYVKWKKDFRALLEKLLGFQKMTRCEAMPISLGIEQMDGYTREKIVIHTEPGIEMPFFLLKPSNVKPGERLAALIATHGHDCGGKMAICGMDGGYLEIRDRIAKYNCDYGVQFVKKGFIVFAPDARGFGERAEKYEQNDQSVLHSSCAYINSMAYPLGLCQTGMWTWDLMRLVDYILTRDDVDAARVNCAGLSGGGLQSLWLGAMDERVKNVIISGYFYGYKQALLEMFNCSCNYVPHLFENADIGDIASLAANRGIFIETGDKDPLNGEGGVENVIPQVNTVKKAAALLHNEKSIAHHVFPGPHQWCGEKAIPWMCERNFG